MEKEKKGVSPVISTVLLILIVIIIAIIILLWSKGFLKEKLLKNEKPIDQICSEIKIMPFVNEDNTFGYTNQGNVPIEEIDLLKIENGDETVTRLNKNDGGRAGIGASTEFKNINYDNNIEYKIIPVILGVTKSGVVKPYVCSDKYAVKV